MAKRIKRAKKKASERTVAKKTIKERVAVKSSNEGTLKLIAVLLLVLSVVVIIVLTVRITE